MTGVLVKILMLILAVHVENIAVLNNTDLSSFNKTSKDNAQRKMNESCNKKTRRKEDVWKYFNGKCYKFIHQEEYFINAQQHCQNYEGDLTSIHNKAENDFITQLIKEADHRFAWIGLRKKSSKSKYLWVGDIEGVFFNWMINAPSQIPDKDCVAMIRGGEWYNTLCYSQKSFVCKKDPDPANPDSKLRIILTITISVSCIFIMFTFVGFLCVKSHKELEAVESQAKEAVPFEIVKAAMVLPMAKPPDLLDHKVDTTWQRTIKSISTPHGNKNNNNVNNNNNNNKNKINMINSLRDSRDSPALGCVGAITEESDDREESDHDIQRACVNTSTNNNNNNSNNNNNHLSNSNTATATTATKPSPDNQSKLTRNSNYLSKVDKWLKESPESPTTRKRTEEGSVRRKHFQQRGSQKRSDIKEIPELEENAPFKVEDEEEEKGVKAKPNLLDHSVKKTLQRQNVISVTADVNFPRNNSTSTSDTDNAKSPCLGAPDKRRKRGAALSRPEREVNGNFLFLKTLTYSQDTDFSDLSEQRNDERMDPKNLSIDEEPEPLEEQYEEPYEEPFVEILDEIPDSPTLHHRSRGRKLKDEYQLVTFV